MEKITREEAEGLLRSWADFMELDTDRDLFIDLVEELRGSVRNNRLTFDKETEVFSYQLIKPIEDIQIVQIKECDFKQKKIIQNYKDSESIESAGAMLSKYVTLTVPQIEKAKDYLNKGGLLQVVARHNKGGKQLELKMKGVFGNVESIAKKSGYRIYVSKSP